MLSFEFCLNTFKVSPLLTPPPIQPKASIKRYDPKSLGLQVRFAMALKIIDHFDGSFTLDPDAKAALFELLKGDAFLQQVSQQTQWLQVEFTEWLFQPVPYSATTPRGMPAEFEKFYTAADYTIINVPPNFMFKAKIFKPSRLCAVYRNVSES